jgi:Zn-dependent protease with chaperone function
MDELSFARIVTMSFYYAASSEDRTYLINRLKPVLTQKGTSVDLSFNTLKHEAQLLTSNQKLLLMTYFHMYVLLRDRNLLEDADIKSIRDVFLVSDDFVAYYMRSMRRAHYKKWIDESSLLECILNPCEEFQKWAEDTTYGAVQEGCYIKKRILHGLSKTEYEHPQDTAAMEALSKIPGIDKLVRKVNEHGLDKLYRVVYSGSNIKVTTRNFPQLYRALLTVCEVLNLGKIPEFYVEQGFINALTVGVENPIVVIKSAAISLLSYDELLFLLGHEVAHIKSEHMLYHQIAQIFPFISGLMGAIGSLVGSGLQVALLNWYRKSEYTADRGGLLACQDINAAVSAMMKIAGAPMRYYKALNPADFLEQAREFEGMDDDKMNTMAKYLSIMFADHPWTVMRASEMDKWVNNGIYRKIVEKCSGCSSLPESMRVYDGR